MLGDPASVENVITSCVMRLFMERRWVFWAIQSCLQRVLWCCGELERVVVRSLANLVGYDPTRLLEVFTQGWNLLQLIWVPIWHSQVDA